MTTLAQARDLIVAGLEAAWSHAPSTPIYYENTTQIDLATAPDTFLKAAIHWNGNEQVSVERAPITRAHGTLAITVAVKKTTGTRLALTYLDELIAALQFKSFGGVRMLVPRPGNEVTRDGWFSIDLRTNFYADSNS